MRKWLKRIGFVIVAGTTLFLATICYAYFIEPNRLVITDATISLPNFSQKLSGLKIVAISDIHAGSNGVTQQRLRDLVAKANDQSPDLIVLLGDYVSEKPRSESTPNNNDPGLRMEVSQFADNLAGFKAKYGVFAVIGNHDWWYDQSLVTKEFERVGINVLENEVAPIVVGDEIIYLWGIEDLWKKGRVPLENTYAQIVEKKNIIAITHNPDSLLRTPDGIALMLAGHSHGGQVNFPFYGPYPFVNDIRFMKGEAAVDGKIIFVTSGVGCTGPQIRFRVPPEIAVLTLKNNGTPAVAE